MKNIPMSIQIDYLTYTSLIVAETIAKCEMMQVKAASPRAIFNQWSKSKNILYSSESNKPAEIVMAMVALAVMFTFLAVVIDKKVSPAAIVKGFYMTLCFMKLYDDNYGLREALGGVAEKFK